MELKLTMLPKNVTIIHGFPGFGMVGAIATEFLLEHLKTEQIGRINIHEVPAMTALHSGKVVEPIGIFYSKLYNLVVVHAIMAPKKNEWNLAEKIVELATKLSAKEIISLEGVGSMEESTESNVYFYSESPATVKKLTAAKMHALDDGIILGITAALMVTNRKQKLTCLFAETHTNLPDSKAAAKLIEALDKYLKLKVDTKPLVQMADNFEQKLRGIMRNSQEAQESREKKEMSYVG